MSEHKLVAVVETKGAKTAADSLNNFAKAAANSEKRNAALAKGLKIGAVAFVGYSASVIAVVNIQRDLIDQSGKVARALGGTTAGMQALERTSGRAGIGVEELRAAAQRLNASLGDVVREGSGQAHKALQRLRLDAVELSKMDIDQRFAAIADRMREMGYSTQLAASELRKLGIRQSSVITLMQDGGDAIRSSRDQLDQYGVALSEIDTAKVESMNDALGELSIISTGYAQQLTAMLAPAIESIAIEFSSAAVEAGGVGNAAERSYQMMIDGAAFVIDAIDGINRALSITADSSITVGARVYAETTRQVGLLLRGLSHMPGINFEKQTQALFDITELNRQAAGFAAANINDTLMREMAGTGEFTRRMAEIRAEADKAASATVLARKDRAANDIVFDAPATDDRAARELEAQKKASESFLEQTRFMGLSQLALIEEQERSRLDTLRGFANQGLIEYADFEDAKTAILQQAANERADLEYAQQQLILGSAASMFDSMAGMAETFGDKQSATYKTLFALSKGFAIAQAGLAISAAAAALGDPAVGTADRIANYASVLAAVGNITSALSSVSMGGSAREQGGQFSAGQRMLVGERGPELVEFGTGGRVANQSQMPGGAPSITIVNQTSGRIDSVETQQMDDGRVILIVREVLRGEVTNPNSDFNKDFSKTRQAPRRF